MQTDRQKIDRNAARQAFRERWYRRRFLVPNAVTVGNMFCGFLAIIYAAGALNAPDPSIKFTKAAIAILFAILLDGLDGRAARRLNATSKFGVEFDSFSDLVSFGVAPALVVYYWCFVPLADEFGVLVAFIYALCAASRLARFNITPSILTSFEGLPSPAAAATVAALVNFWPQANHSYAHIPLSSFFLLGLGFLMVSKIEFYSIKMLKINRLRWYAFVVLGGVIGLIWYNHQVGFLAITAAYALSGPFAQVTKRMGILRKARKAELLKNSGSAVASANTSNTSAEIVGDPVELDLHH